MFRFRPLMADDLEQVMHWRNSQAVSQFMQTDIAPDLQVQQAWYANISQDPSRIYWIVETQGKSIGLVNLANMRAHTRECCWGFYIGDANYRNLGGLLPPYLYNFLFQHTRLHSLIADVMENNTLVQKLHKMHGYQDLGLLPMVVEKGAEHIGLRRFVLHRINWLQKKRFAKYTAQFEPKPLALM